MTETEILAWARQQLDAIATTLDNLGAWEAAVQVWALPLVESSADSAARDWVAIREDETWIAESSGGATGLLNDIMYDPFTDGWVWVPRIPLGGTKRAGMWLRGTPDEIARVVAQWRTGG